MKEKINRQIKSRIMSIVFILVILVVGTIYGVKAFKDNDKDPNIDNPVVNEEPKIEEYSASMVMVGDALIHSSVYKDANRLANYSGYDFKPQIEFIKEKVNGYDIAYYNQETILGGTSLGLSDYPTFNSPQEVGDAMIDAGFNLVSLATNHTVDRGKNAVLASREYWNNKEGVHAVGSYSSFEEKQELETKILEVNNITYAMLNYTYGTNEMPVADEYLFNVWNDINNFEGYKENVRQDVMAIRDEVDVLMVAMHWGREYTQGKRT